MEKSNELEYRMLFIELLFGIKEKIIIVLISTIMAAISGWGVSSFFMSPQYEASVNMIVNAQTNVNGYITNDSLSSAQKLTETYAIIIKSNTVLNHVIENLKLEMSYEELYEQVTVNAINETQVMKISVLNENPLAAEEIVQEIAKTAPSIVADAVEAGSCKVISQVSVNNEPVSPDVAQNTIIAGMLGFVLCAAVIVMRELLNDYIVDEFDVEKKLGIPALGIIPDMESK